MIVILYFRGSENIILARTKKNITKMYILSNTMPYEWMTSHPHSTCNDSFSFGDEQLLDNVELAQMFVTMK